MFDVYNVCHALFSEFLKTGLSSDFLGGKGTKLEVFWEVWRCAAGPAELG